ncbi:EAF7 [Candida theae]|uniref:Chromatin modification-related protein EAF7 n=1 Tax=Candida theae TaxID=1198502 RepID=A0AAD5BAI2_9ASCO|nr:EAF7 [Candida theae]KAI5948921.1 EAF7 [Candida theae]
MSEVETTSNEKKLLPSRSWSIDEEIKLFSLVCDYKPAGPKKHENMAIIIGKINEDIQPQETPLSESDIWEKLQQLYNLPKIDLLEGLSSDEVANNDNLENGSDDSTVSEEIPKTRAQRRKPPVKIAKEKDSNNIANSDSEDEETNSQGEVVAVKPEKQGNAENTAKSRKVSHEQDFPTRRRLRNSVVDDSTNKDQSSDKIHDKFKDETKDNESDDDDSLKEEVDNSAEKTTVTVDAAEAGVDEDATDAAPARRTRGRRHNADNDNTSAEPPRKKLRSSVKAEDSSDELAVEPSSNKGKSTTRASSPPPARRRTRSEAHIEHDNETGHDDKHELGKGKENEAVEQEDDSEEDTLDKKKSIKAEKASDKTKKEIVESSKTATRRSSRAGNTTHTSNRQTPPVRRSSRKR